MTSPDEVKALSQTPQESRLGRLWVTPQARPGMLGIRFGLPSVSVKSTPSGVLFGLEGLFSGPAFALRVGTNSLAGHGPLTGCPDFAPRTGH